jgi:hypothetical protein
MPATGLLTQRCDPYGIESTVRLMGGLFPENQMGRYIWYCAERAEARFRYVCTGGDYGFRRQNDGGLVEAHHCQGGHQGVVMPLCRKHQRDLAVGPPQPGWHSDLKTPYGQIGGTKSNEMCPACTVGRGTRWEQEIRDRMDAANTLQQQLSALMCLPLPLMSRMTELERLLDAERGHLNELHERGIIHKCPLKLVEVS